MSENSLDNVKCIARVWRLTKKQKELFKALMGREISSNLRRVCSNGYMISLLYKKEIGNLYEAVKCNLNDGDLVSVTRNMDMQATKEDDPVKLLALLIDEQKRLMEAYEALIPHLDQGSEAALACRQHVDELGEIRYTLLEELALASPESTSAYSSVA